MKQVVSYSNKNFSKSQEFLDNSLKNLSKNIIHRKFSQDDLPQEFLKKNKAQFESKRGGGYWVWKPFIILDSLLKAKDGDFIGYVDSGMAVSKDINILFDYFADHNGDIFLFQNHGLPNQVWTKRDCFHLMDCDNEHFYFKDQVNAAVQIYRRSERSIQFLKEYLNYCEDFQVVSDSKNIYTENFLSFKEHRHDQSVLTNLAYLNNIPLYRNPTQYGNHLLDKEFIKEGMSFPYGMKEFENPFPDSHYPTIFDHHRKRFNYRDTKLKRLVLSIRNKLKS